MIFKNTDCNQSFKVSEELTRWEFKHEYGLEADLFQLRNEYEQYIEDELTINGGNVKSS